MENEKIKALVTKYNEGVADPSEIKLVESLLEEGEIAMTDLQDLHQLDEALVKMDHPAPSMELDNRFYNMLSKEKRSGFFNFRFQWPSVNVLMPRLAFATVLVIAGFVSGYLVNGPSSTGSVNDLTQEVSDLKEMVMLSLLEKESATDRLKAVSLTGEMDRASQKVTHALIQTLNSDNDVNVRLAALEALKPYIGDGKVRGELIRSIGLQDSPLVQVSLAELMEALHEKKSVDELQRIVEDDRTPQEVKNKIKQSIDVII